jgi:pimeloyl-ACP methyl ester carboxylesterase
MPILNHNGVKLYYEEQGAGEPVLFIHGLGSSGQDWEVQTAAFSPHYRVITYDLRGHGRSDKPAGPYSMTQFAGDAAALLQALGVTSAHVVGLSLGGGVAFQLAVDQPSLVRSLTIVNSAPEMVPRTFKEKFGIWQRLAIVRLMGLPKMAAVLSSRLFPDPNHEHLRQMFTERFAQNEQPAYLASLHALIGWSVTARLGEIKCPTLVITADQDYTPVALKEAYVAKMPNARLTVIANAHHATPMERPEAFNAALAEFLAQQK